MDVSGMTMRPSPWANWAEWTQVCEQFFPSAEVGTLTWRENVENALVQTEQWRARSSIPVAVCGTAALLEAALADKTCFKQRTAAGTPPEDDAPHSTHVSEYSVRSLYSLAIVRFVNGLADARQGGKYAMPVHTLWHEMGWPTWIVDLRHQATHGALPRLPILRLAAQQLLGLLQERYWDAQRRKIPRNERFLVSGNTDSISVAGAGASREEGAEEFANGLESFLSNELQILSCAKSADAEENQMDNINPGGSPTGKKRKNDNKNKGQGKRPPSASDTTQKKLSSDRKKKSSDGNESSARKNRLEKLLSADAVATSALFDASKPEQLVHVIGNLFLSAAVSETTPRDHKQEMRASTFRNKRQPSKMLPYLTTLLSEMIEVVDDRSCGAAATALLHWITEQNPSAAGVSPSTCVDSFSQMVRNLMTQSDRFSACWTEAVGMSLFTTLSSDCILYLSKQKLLVGDRKARENHRELCASDLQSRMATAIEESSNHVADDVAEENNTVKDSSPCGTTSTAMPHIGGAPSLEELEAGIFSEPSLKRCRVDLEFVWTPPRPGPLLSRTGVNAEKTTKRRSTDSDRGRLCSDNSIIVDEEASDSEKNEVAMEQVEETSAQHAATSPAPEEDLSPSSVCTTFFDAKPEVEEKSDSKPIDIGIFEKLTPFI
ncbi:unnamed protein product [Amoebophrya sp. A25]|nr:unnamed protein product [Amoebophrya sp. A25]|eukprot:GSA25T00015618001.1